MKMTTKYEYLRKCSAIAFGAALYAVPVVTSAAEQAPVESNSEDGPATSAGTENAGGAAIVVTGSRIAREGFEAPTPTTVLDSATINNSPQVSVATVLNQLPALSGSISPRTSATLVGGGTQGANFLNLRDLGVNRTLVMLDRRRIVPAATTGGVDINLLPSALLDRVDIVTGGGSAAWGSDAVAGIVNFILDEDFVGLKGSALAGVSKYGDGEEYRFDLAGGLEFAGGRGHIIASVEYSQNDSIDRVDSRPWFTATKVVNNPAYAPGNGEPRRLVAPNIGQNLMTDGGLILNTQLRGTQFGPGGVPTLFVFGNATGLLQQGGTFVDLAGSTQILAAVEQVSTFVRTTYEVTDNIELFGEVGYGRTIADSESVPFFNFGGTRIQRDNAFLPAATAAAMDNAGITNFNIGLTNRNLGNSNPHNVREQQRYVIGADVDLGGSWKANAYYQRGISNILNEARNDVIRPNFAQAVDAVFDGGRIVCRSTLTNPGNGCVPLNVFGGDAPDPAAAAYVLGTAVQNIRVTQDVASVSANGDAFELPAGPVAIAFGAEYRKEGHVATADPLSITNSFWVGNYKPSDGGYNVKEAFTEVLIPVLRDSPIGRSIDLNGAIRFTDYSTSGSVTTWKAGVIYDIAAGVKFRGTLSHDIRAPNLNEFFLGGSAQSQQVVDPANPGSPTSFLRVLSGNANLAPEKADTITLGMVYQPEFVPGLSLSVDYYDIEIDGAIATLTNEQIVNRCFEGQQELCQFITRNGAGAITQILVKPVNFRTEKLSGIDFEASYRRSIGETGSLSIRNVINYTEEHTISDGIVTDDLVGEFSSQLGNTGPAKWRSLTSISYDNEHVGFSLRHRYIGAGVIDASFTSADINRNKISAANYFDITATKKIKSGSSEFELFVSVDNLLNESPPVAPAINGQLQASSGAAQFVHDLVGRFYRVGARFKM